MINEVDSKANKAVVFKTLTSEHQNIESNTLPYSSYAYPILAFKKESFSSFSSLFLKISSKPQLLDYQN